MSDPTPDCESRPLIFHLVHGTFANKATWISDTSDFSEALKNAFPGRVRILPFRWSGRNNFSARARAAADLAAEVTADAAKRPEAARLVFAHSHGGNVVAYALRDPAVAAQIKGGVFLATPFFSYRLLPSWEFLINGFFSPLLVFAFLTMFTIVTVAVQYLISFDPFAAIPMPQREWVEIATFTLLNWVTLFAAYSGFLLINLLKLKFMRSRLRAARDFSNRYSASLPPSFNALFIRTSGDEAAAFLGFFQTLTWLLTIINVAVSRIFQAVSRLWGFRKAKSRLKPAIFLLCCAIVYTAAVAMQSDPSLGIRTKPDFSSTENYFLQLGAYQDAKFKIWLHSMTHLQTEWRVFVALSIMILFLLVMNLVFWTLPIFFVLSCIILACNWFLNFAFGRVPVFVGGILQVAVEPTPPGSWQVIHVSWDRSSASRGLFWRHSNPYNERRVIAEVAQWIRRLIVVS
jgi:hypothetical protein